MCVYVGCGVLQEVMLTHLQESTGLIDPFMYVCLHTCKALVWAETPLIYRGSGQCACVHACVSVYVCVFAEGVTGAQVSECVSVLCSNLHTYTQTHVLLHPSGTGSGVCVCTIPDIRNCCFERSCMALLLKALIMLCKDTNCPRPSVCV